jgi:hypothetical protein
MNAGDAAVYRHYGSEVQWSLCGCCFYGNSELSPSADVDCMECITHAADEAALLLGGPESRIRKTAGQIQKGADRHTYN